MYFVTQGQLAFFFNTSVDALLAQDTAARFDATPNYSIGTISFLSGIKNEKMDDILGKTATESLEGCRKGINDHEFDELWNKITDRKV